jgi:hypothetical protein
MKSQLQRSLRLFRAAARSLLPLTALAAGTACGDPAGLEAELPTAASEFSVYAVTGSSAGLPSAISVPANLPVVIDGNLFYDVVFDIDAQGKVVLYPLELTVWNAIGAHRVGIQKSPGSYESISRAPASGYVYDESLTASVGDAIVIESNETRICQFPFPARLYAKIVIDEINLMNRSVAVRMTQNPNCGFRSFLPGVPTD